MAQRTKVEAELNFDTNAQKILGELQTGFDGLQEEVQDSNDGLKQFLSTFAAMTAANLVQPIMGGIRDMSTASFELASQAYDTQQSIAGMMAAMSPREWASARGSAELLYGDFTDLSIAIGQSKDDIQAGHAAMVAFLGSNERAFDVASGNLSNLTSIANVAGFSVQELGGQFGKMAAGFLSTESPIFNMLRSTGIFANDITKVTKEWQQLTQEERIGRLEGAFGSIAENLSEAAPTMSDMVTSMKETGVAFLESFGGAALRQVLDEMQDLRGALNEGGDSFDKFATSLGRDFGGWLAEVIEDLTAAIDYLRENGAEIKQEIIDAFTFAKDTFNFMVDNAGLIGAGFVAAKAGPGLAPTAMQFGSGLMGGGGAAGGLAGRAGAAIPAAVSALVAGGPPIWAAAAAATALTGAFAYMTHESAKAERAKRQEIDRIIAAERERSETLRNLSELEFQAQVRERERLIELADELGERTKQINRLADASADRRAMRAQYVDPAAAAAENLAMMQTVEGDPTNILVRRQTQELAVSEMTSALRKAVETGDTEVSKALVMILLENERLKQAFANTADTVAIGAEGLKLSLRALEETGHGGGNLAGFFKAELEREFPKPAKTQINFNGGQTFKIQQEFRDQDPDRIAVAFERRITQSAVSRVQASTSAPFGA